MKSLFSMTFCRRVKIERLSKIEGPTEIAFSNLPHRPFLLSRFQPQIPVLV
jgi:hypothetical protein